jgi:hypothetical protein
MFFHQLPGVVMNTSESHNSPRNFSIFFQISFYQFPVHVMNTWGSLWRHQEVVFDTSLDLRIGCPGLFSPLLEISVEMFTHVRDVLVVSVSVSMSVSTLPVDKD